MYYMKVDINMMKETEHTDEELLLKELQEFLETHGIDEAVIIFKTPYSDHPITYWPPQHHFYEAAKLVAEATREFRSRIISDIMD